MPSHDRVIQRTASVEQRVEAIQLRSTRVE